MANAHYAKGKEKILSGAVNYPADTIKVALVKNTYPQNLATDEFFGPSLSAYVVGTPQTLISKAVAGGVLDADDVTFLTVAAGIGFYAFIGTAPKEAVQLMLFLFWGLLGLLTVGGIVYELIRAM